MVSNPNFKTLSDKFKVPKTLRIQFTILSLTKTKNIKKRYYGQNSCIQWAHEIPSRVKDSFKVPNKTIINIKVLETLNYPIHTTLFQI